MNAVADKLQPSFKPRNAIERATYKMYDSVAMDGLPVGVQIVGKRLEEEKVLDGMRIIENALKARGLGYKLLNV